jgi:hypothetical protein
MKVILSYRLAAFTAVVRIVPETAEIIDAGIVWQCAASATACSFVVVKAAFTSIVVSIPEAFARWVARAFPETTEMHTRTCFVSFVSLGSKRKKHCSHAKKTLHHTFSSNIDRT